MGFALSPNVQALLFDLDGTLIDSMPLHQLAWIEWHRRHGVAMDEPAFFSATAGRSNHEILLDMLPGRSDSDYDSLVDEKEALYREHASVQLNLIAGAKAYVGRARAQGLRLAICTASTPKNMQLAFDKHGLNTWVDTVTSPADGLRGKPHPDIFLEAARRLGVAPEHCVVFEDAPLGIEAARRAGMQTVALTTTLPAEAFAGFDNVLAVAADFEALVAGAASATDILVSPHIKGVTP